MLINRLSENGFPENSLPENGLSNNSLPARILIVEDEQLFAMDLQEQLEQMGYGVVAIADNAVAAVEAVKQFQPDLVLMDIHIRGNQDGIQTALQIQAYDVPIIFLTAHADAATLTQAKATHPFGYLVKPIQNQNLGAAIAIALSRHQAEQTMRQALEKERDLKDLKTQFISIVSHEFRNPLSAIFFTLEILEHPSSELSPEKRLTQIQRAKVAAQQINQLIEDVLVVGEIEATQFQCRPLPLDIHWLCRDVIEEFQTRMDSSHILSFKNANCQSENSFYSLDVKLVRHILNNLLSNAVKYSPDGGEIHLNLDCGTNALTLRIQDQGVGIPLADQKRLFHSFQRGTNVSTIPGSGLGLAIVKQCVDAHGGEIFVDSTVDVGTTITVTLQSVNRES